MFKQNRSTTIYSSWVLNDPLMNSCFPSKSMPRIKELNLQYPKTKIFTDSNKAKKNK
jgi:hypothetical protein